MRKDISVLLLSLSLTLIFVSCSNLTSSPEVSPEVPFYPVGTWESVYGEVYDISEEAVVNLFDTSVIYSGNIQDKLTVTANSGVIYFLLTKGSEWTPEGTYYAVAYRETSEDYVELSAAATSFATLSELKEACPFNSFAYFSSCTRK